MPHDVGIKRGQELNRWRDRLLTDPIRVWRQKVGASAFDVDRDDVTSQAGPCCLPNSGPVAPPTREVFLGRRSVGSQVSACNLDQRLIRVNVAPGPQPYLGPDEGHALAARWPEAQKAAARGGLENRAPARLHDVADVRRSSLCDF